MTGFDLKAEQAAAAYRLEAMLDAHVAAAQRRIKRYTPTETQEARDGHRPSEISVRFTSIVTAVVEFTEQLAKFKYAVQGTAKVMREWPRR